ncbi:hypothetical protein RCL1_006300 [Eukaryota sp. TZLM3-RCL]
MNDFQAVLFCWPEGSLNRVLQHSSLALLPIVNVPLIDFHLSALSNCGISNVIVVVPPKDYSIVADHLSTFHSLHYLCVHGDPADGSVSVLHKLVSDGSITRDILVLSICTVTTLSLHHYLDVFRSKQASCVFLTHRTTKSTPPLEECFTMLTAADSDNKVVGLLSGEEVHEARKDGNLSVPLGVLSRHPHVFIETDLSLAQLFIFSFACVSRLLHAEPTGTIWNNLLPKLIMDSLNDSRNYSVFAFVQDKGLCVHLSTPKSVQDLCYAVMNPKNEFLAGKIQLGPFTNVSNAEKKINIKNCRFGNNVSLPADGDFRLDGSVIGDRVVIEKGTVVIRSILVPDSRIGERCSIKNSLICGVPVGAKSIVENSVICDDCPGGEVVKNLVYPTEESSFEFTFE